MYVKLIRQNPDFARLWSAQVISLLGDWFNTIVLSALVAAQSNGSALAVSTFLLARFLPSLIVGPYAGVIVDRFDRKQVLVYSNWLRVIVVLGFLFALEPGRLWLVYTLTVIQFVLSAFFEPGQSAILPLLVKTQDLVRANTLFSVTWSLMLAVGAIAGGVVSALFGPATALLFDAFTFAVAGFVINTIKTDTRVAEVTTEAPHYGRDLIDGLRYVRNRPVTAITLYVKGGSSLISVDTVMTIAATQLFVLGDGGEISLGLMYSAFGVGAVIGPLVLNRFTNGTISRLITLIAVGFVLTMAGWLTLTMAYGLWMYLLAIFIRSTGASANWTYSSVILQRQVEDRFMGRVFSLDMAFFQLMIVVNLLGHGLLIDWLGVDRMILVIWITLGISMFNLLFWVLTMRHPRIVSEAAAAT